MDYLKPQMETPNTTDDIEKPVSIDFHEFDIMRATFKELAKKHKWNLHKRYNTPYEYSTFYVGRGVTRFSFVNIRGSYDQSKAIAKALEKEFPGYRIRHFYGCINVYLRGDTKKQIEE
jgi:hypothetical protein